jgi:hypothetical protein
MRTPKGILTLAIGGAAMAFSACQNPAGTSATGASEPVPQNGTLLYSDTFADGGMLQIVSGPDNEINYSVQTPIGSEAEKRMRLSSSRATLAEVYRALHPDASEVPAKVQVISDDLASRRAFAPATPDLSTPMASAPLAKTAAAYDDWKSAYCRTFIEGSIAYRFIKGAFKYGANVLTPDAGLNSNGVLMDRSYGWNMTSWTATMMLSRGGINDWKPTLSPNSVGWVQWGGVYQNVYPAIVLPTGKVGQIAITAHRAIRATEPFPRIPF